jgi:hypothetical protein
MNDRALGRDSFVCHQDVIAAKLRGLAGRRGRTRAGTVASKAATSVPGVLLEAV